MIGPGGVPWVPPDSKCRSRSKEKVVIRIVDRLLERIVPKATASACAGMYLCNGADHPGLWWRNCCPQFGCQWVYIGPC
jgi:hypothetical protein